MSVETRFETANDMSSSDPLARRLANGDLAAPRDLAERYHAALYRYALGLLGDPSAAEDAVQEAFERAFAALGKYSEERIGALSVRAWLYRITLNVVRNAWRERRRAALVTETQEGLNRHFETASGFATCPDRETWLDTLGALEQLSERQRVAVALRYFEDLPYAEIAEATGWPENTCKTLVRRGIGRLGVLLGEPSRKGVVR
jgi:RNA polymerase sigma-70 factor, ECF subfamily